MELLNFNATKFIVGVIVMHCTIAVAADSQTQGYAPEDESAPNATAEEGEGIGGTSELPARTIGERVQSVLTCYNATTCGECEQRPECSWCGGAYTQIDWRPMCLAHNMGECWHSPFDGMKSGHRRTSVEQCPAELSLGYTNILQVPISYNLYSPAHVAHVL